MLSDPGKRCGCGAGHKTFGSCLRAKRLQFTEISGHEGRRAWDRELTSYADARRQGIKPGGTTQAAVDEAVRYADATGRGE